MVSIGSVRVLEEGEIQVSDKDSQVPGIWGIRTKISSILVALGEIIRGKTDEEILENPVLCSAVQDRWQAYQDCIEAEKIVTDWAYAPANDL